MSTHITEMNLVLNEMDCSSIDTDIDTEQSSEHPAYKKRRVEKQKTRECLLSLPEDIVVSIIEMIDPLDLVHLIHSSKRYKDQLDTDLFWTQFCLRAITNTPEGSAKETFKKIVILKKHCYPKMFEFFPLEFLVKGRLKNLSRRVIRNIFIGPEEFGQSNMIIGLDGLNMGYVAFLLEREFISEPDSYMRGCESSPKEGTTEMGFLSFNCAFDRDLDDNREIHSRDLIDFNYNFENSHCSTSNYMWNSNNPIFPNAFSVLVLKVVKTLIKADEEEYDRKIQVERRSVLTQFLGEERIAKTTEEYLTTTRGRLSGSNWGFDELLKSDLDDMFQKYGAKALVGISHR